MRNLRNNCSFIDDRFNDGGATSYDRASGDDHVRFNDNRAHCNDGIRVGVHLSPLRLFDRLPVEWTPDPAIERWDGEMGGFGSSNANSDAFEGTMIDNTLWAAGAPTTKGLNDFVSEENAIDAIDHDCENPPDIDETITVDDEPARLTAKNCPIGSKTLIASAAVIKDGVGYFFYFRNVDPDSSSLDVFRELLTGVTLP